MNKVILVVLVLTLAVVAAIFWVKESADIARVPPAEEGDTTETAATFSWRFAEADSLNLDGLPQTNVFLTIARGDETEERLIDTVDGGCSELEEDKYDGDISNTGNVQCYGAGLGQRYRIIQDDQTYLVERKLFEEALPDTSPPDYEWEVVEQFL